MTQNWIVLIGPPAVGKSTISSKLSLILDAKIYSFDREFSLNRLKEIGCDSKGGRGRFLTMIQDDTESEWIIVDDSCHMKSIQKRYLQAASEDVSKNIKVVFLYISAKEDQISELKLRNGARETLVKSEEIDRMVRFLNLNPPAHTNFLEYNFEKVPSLDILTTQIRSAFERYKIHPHSVTTHEKDSVSDANIYNRINLALTGRISKLLKENRGLDGESVSKAKKAFLLELGGRYGKSSIDDVIELESILEEFEIKISK